ncbi:pentapeptide repeat-containing protein [Rarobacter faecitabidus]|uniref:pentapeptide repeat-containing protein n=1 Tax=Rarobacter faecitabidus TaxID=13243 RepID=UPI003CCC6452
MAAVSARVRESPSPARLCESRQPRSTRLRAYARVFALRAFARDPPRSRAPLRGARLRGASLRGASLRGSSLRGPPLRTPPLRRARTTRPMRMPESVVCLNCRTSTRSPSCGRCATGWIVTSRNRSTSIRWPRTCTCLQGT